MIIQKWITEEEQDALFEHTRQLRNKVPSPHISRPKEDHHFEVTKFPNPPSPPDPRDPKTDGHYRIVRKEQEAKLAPLLLPLSRCASDSSARPYPSFLFVPQQTPRGRPSSYHERLEHRRRSTSRDRGYTYYYNEGPTVFVKAEG